MIRIAAVVVLYNPTTRFLESLDLYRQQVEILYAIDNSECFDPSVETRLGALTDVVYRWNGGNLGVGQPINLAATLAFEQGYEYLLMMDQDSVVPTNLVETFRGFLNSTVSAHIGLLTPFHAYNNYERNKDPRTAVEVPFAITSGTLLNLHAYKECGPFLEDLFVDYVDVEYSLRIREKGFTIVQLNSVVLCHQLGALESRYIFWRRVAVYNHPPERVYYKFRNRLLVANKYGMRKPLWYLKEVFLLLNELTKILLFEQRKYEKLKMAALGVCDYLNHRMGKLRGLSGSPN